MRGRRFDAVLADVPCSNSGVLARRPDARWRWSEPETARLACLEAFAPRESFPGARMRFVSAPRWTDDAIADAVRLAARRDPSLGEPHLASLCALYGGPRHAVTGERIFDGIPPAGRFDLAARNNDLSNHVLYM